MIRKIILLIFSILTLPSYSAGTTVGRVLNVENRVKVFHQNDLRGVLVSKTPFEISFNDKVKTYRNSKAFLLLGNTRLILLERTIVEIKGKNSISQSRGEIVYSVKRLGKVKGKLTVNTPVSIIGVKGTKFLVSISDNRTASVALKEGEVTISSLKEPFKIYKLKEQKSFDAFKQEFENFKSEKDREFETYKRQIEKEFIAFKEKFTLKPGNVVFIKGNEALISNKIPEDLEKKFELLRFFGGDHEKEYK